MGRHMQGRAWALHSRPSGLLGRYAHTRHHTARHARILLYATCTSTRKSPVLFVVVKRMHGHAGFQCCLLSRGSANLPSLGRFLSTCALIPMPSLTCASPMRCLWVCVPSGVCRWDPWRMYSPRAPQVLASREGSRALPSRHHTTPPLLKPPSPFATDFFSLHVFKSASPAPGLLWGSSLPGLPLALSFDLMPAPRFRPNGRMYIRTNYPKGLCGLGWGGGRARAGQGRVVVPTAHTGNTKVGTVHLNHWRQHWGQGHARCVNGG
jgi:hypothetical protein